MIFFDRPVLAIETSCDETSCAVLDGRRVLGHVVSSQVELHRKWGGVVPEAAARAHVEALLPCVELAFERARIPIGAIGGIAVTNRPGLVGALSVGVTAAKAFAFERRLPLVGINHLEGHLLSVCLEHEPPFPHLTLMVSGGHTELVIVRSPGEYEIIGQTIDDAAGEAFDKSARVFGLGYPGGRAIQEAAASGTPGRYRLPVAGVKGRYDVSFSGLKTAALRLAEAEGDKLDVASASMEVQRAIVESLVRAVDRALDDVAVQSLCLVGGVAANSALRLALGSHADRRGVPFFVPSMEYCTDNAAMIGLAGSWRLGRGECHGWDMDASSQSDW